MWLVRSPGTVFHIGHSFRTYMYIINVRKHAQGTSFLTFLLHWLTVSRVQAAEIVQRPCSDPRHVTAPYCHFIVMIMIIFMHKKNPMVAQKLQNLQRFVWHCTQLWPVVINKTVVQRNWIKSLHRNGNSLKQKRRSSNIHVIVSWLFIFACWLVS